ncbi:hypothetical protein CGCSCA5_v009885 [Colletotrichum siamense]|nr:hypothetical protein CGCSCA5_v009885 [Colletotrichum siamense]KAF4861385.1 hypothetical protein CGCSCA1_v014905 [Colletotrichum siamense]
MAQFNQQSSEQAHAKASRKSAYSSSRPPMVVRIPHEVTSEIVRPKLLVLEPPYEGPNVHEVGVKAVGRFMPVSHSLSCTKKSSEGNGQRGPDLWPLWSWVS